MNYETKPKTRNLIFKLLLNSKVHELIQGGKEGAVVPEEERRVNFTSLIGDIMEIP